MGEKLFIYRYKSKQGMKRSRRNVSLRWTFLSIVIFFTVLALFPFLNRTRQKKSQIIYEVPGKNVLIKKVPLPATMRNKTFPSLRNRGQMQHLQKEEGAQIKPETRSAKGSGKTSGKKKTAREAQGKATVSTLRVEKIKTGASEKLSGKKSVETGKTVYIVQVGAFKEEKNALNLMGRLRKKGYKVFLSPEKHPSLGIVYRVNLDPVSDLVKARALKVKLLKEEAVSSIFIKTEKR